MRSAFFIGCLILLVSPRLLAQEFKVVPFGYWPAAKDRMELIVDENWPSAPGIRMIPFRLRYASGNPKAQDHTFQLLTFPSFTAQFLPRVQSTAVTITAGSNSANGVIFFPQGDEFYKMNYKLVDVASTNFERDFDSINLGRPSALYYSKLQSTYVDPNDIRARATLIFHSELPNLDERFTEYELSMKPPSAGSFMTPGDLRKGQNPTDWTKLDLAQWQQLKRFHTSEASETWLGYSCFQQMVISLENAREMKANAPARWQAIRDWLATGGMLFILETGENFQKLDEVEQLFGFEGGRDQSQDKSFDDWIATTAFEKNGEFVDQTDEAAHQNAHPAQTDSRSVPMVDVNQFGKVRWIYNDEQIRKWNADFLLHPYGLGIVVLLSTKDNQLSLLVPYADMTGETQHFMAFRSRIKDEAWEQLSRFAASNYPELKERAGIDIEEVLNDKFLLEIPGVGDPPVNTFRILITLFFAIVGPLNYFLLRAQRRLHLILFTLPAFALLACVGLILYSLFADGLTTRGRIISYSQIDQRSRQLVSYSHQAYYSPLSADDQLVYSTDSAVFPVVADRLNKPFLSKMQNGTQILSGGNLQARVDNRYMVIRSSSTEAGLEFAENDSLQFRNLLGGTILSVIIRDKEGNFHLAEQVGVGESATATPYSLSAAQAELDNRLDVQDIPVQIRRMQRDIRRDYIDLLMNQDVSKLELGSYLAIVESSTEIPALQPKAKFESSLNIIRGSW